MGLPMFIKTYHPKQSMEPSLESILKVLRMGWITQAKMNGFRAQVHITQAGVANYTRFGSLHTRPLPQAIVEALLALFPLGTVVMGEWVQAEGKLYLFDFLKKDGQVLSRLTYAERYNLLPQGTAGAVETLPIIVDADEAFAALMNEKTEGLVFKNPSRVGFDSNAIIRCRRCGVNYQPQRREK